jgi:hypothetical protein
MCNDLLTKMSKISTLRTFATGKRFGEGFARGKNRECLASRKSGRGEKDIGSTIVTQSVWKLFQIGGCS